VQTAPPSGEVAGSAGFVGRQKELTDLKADLTAALAGKGRLILLAGEPGIGKTRTAQELAAYAETRGAQVLWGRCYDDEGAPPYLPWMQSLKSYLERASPEQLRADLGPGAPDIGDMVPEVREKLPDLESLPAMEPEQARFRLFNSVSTFLRNASLRTPLVLVLDDLHWADQSSLLLLQFLSQQLGDFSLLVLGTYRDTEVNPQHPLSDTLAQLTREPVFRRQSLGGLSLEDAGQFIEITAGVRPAQQLIDVVYTRTEGNPFFTAEVVRFLNERGELRASEASQTAATAIPVGVLEVIGSRLNRLSSRCRQTLTTAAVIGREFDFQLLTLLSEEISEEQLLNVIDEALEAHLIEELPSGRERYQFCHALVRETLTHQLSSSRKVRQHARVAQALEKLYAPEPGSHAAELAYHFWEAVTLTGPEKLMRYSLLAGEQALATYSWEVALAHFERGLEVKESQPMDAMTAALLFGLGRAQLATLPRERMEEAVTSLDRSSEYYARAGDVTNAVTVAEYPLPRGFRERSKVEPRIERGLALVPPDSIDAGRILPTYGMELGQFENDYDRAQEAFEHALAIGRREGDAGLEIRTLAAWAQVDYFHLHLAECLEKSLNVIGLARHARNPHLEVDGHLHALQTLIHLGDSKNAEAHVRAGLALAERLKARRWLIGVLRCGVNLYRFLGEWDQARELASLHLALEPDEVPLFKELASLEYELGEFEQGMYHLKRMQDIMRRTPPRPGPEYADTSLVSHFADRITGSTDNLDIAGQAARVVLSSPMARPFWIEIVKTGLALRAVQTRDPTLAEELYPALAGLQGKMRGSYIGADRLMGLLSQTMGNLDQAVSHFEEALAFCRKEGFRPELAWSCYDYANALLQRDGPGERTRATSLLDEALPLSTELGMRPLIERVVAAQQQVQSQHSKGDLRTTSTYPNGLTEREVEVLRLVAAGKSNAEIAAELVLSIRTVERHISNIYGKTSSHNRADAASFAFRYGLISPNRPR
jgi:DNA-binding CsgD family transcriptional regulator/tetratricopeptide (TPR) repeat protein